MFHILGLKLGSHAEKQPGCPACGEKREKKVRYERLWRTLETHLVYRAVVLEIPDGHRDIRPLQDNAAAAILTLIPDSVIRIPWEEAFSRGLAESF